MNNITNLYHRFERWAEELPQAQFAALNGTIFFVVWVGLGLLLGGLSVVGAVLGALVFGGMQYLFDSR